MKDKLGSLFMCIWLCLEIFVGYLLVYSSDYDDGWVTQNHRFELMDPYQYGGYPVTLWL